MRIVLLLVLHSLMVHGDLDFAVMKLKEDFEDLKDTVAAQKSAFYELKSENDQLKASVDELKSENDELKCKYDEDIEKMTATVDAMASKNSELTKEISFLRNPPFYHLSVYRHQTSAKSSVMTFDKT